MKPGATTRPLASMVVLPESAFSEITTIFPARSPMLRFASRLDSGSITRPLIMTTSYESGVAAAFHAAVTIVVEAQNKTAQATRTDLAIGDDLRALMPSADSPKRRSCARTQARRR